MEYKTRYPALEAEEAKRAADPEWAAAEDAKTAAIVAENRKRAYEKDYKVDMDEYWKLFNADKERFIARGCSEELAYKLACSSAQYREDKRLGLSTDQEAMMDDLTWATRVAELLKQLNNDLEELEQQRGKTLQQEATTEAK